MKTIRPFGPTVGTSEIPKELIKKLNDYVDKILLDEKKMKKQDYGNMLAGNVKQEFLLDNDFAMSSGWIKFLMENTYQWIFQSTTEKITQFKIIDTWIGRQFENDYNPLHAHGGHVSGVGYLKLPDDYGETEQKIKEQNFNGKLQLVHGSQAFMSPVKMDITPKVGSFYIFPHYLMHSVYPFKNKKAERRSISFNALIDPKVFNVQ
jgi:hypothetical protein